MSNKLRFRLRVFRAVTFASMLFCTSIALAKVDYSQKLDEFLSQGKLTDSAEYFSKICETTPKDSQARLALGLTQFAQAIERLGKSNFRYGLISKRAQLIPIARLPIPLNDKPEQISYEKLRGIISELESGLRQAESTLAEVNTAEVNLDFFIGRVRLDMDGDGVIANTETMWKAFSAINSGVNAAIGNDFYVGVDGADVHWLRGYCHVLMAICDVVLAHDETELFLRCGHFLFLNVESPYALFKEETTGNNNFTTEIFDAIAVIHLINFKLVDPDRMTSAYTHLLAMISQSRLSWKLALAENDNNHEWIPNPNQDSVMQMRVPREMITGWSSVLDELEAILDGKKLIPYWRDYVRILVGQSEISERGKGFNLRKFFVEPRDFDLVLTIQGTNAEPFLEMGPLSTPAAWSQMTRVFRGQFFGFAIWFN